MKKLLILFSAALLITCSIPVYAQAGTRFHRTGNIYNTAAKTDDGAQEGETASTSKIPMGEVLPGASYTTIDGETFDTAQVLKEKKAIVINFFRVTCPFCVEEFPLFNELAAEYGDRVGFLALDSNTYDTEDEVKALRDENKIAFPVAQELKWVLSDIIPYAGYPCTVVLDKNGALVFYQDYVIREADEIKEVLNTILADDYESGFVKAHVFEEEYGDGSAAQEDAESTETAETAAAPAAEKGYRIVVKDQNGDPVPNVMINFCSESQGTCRMDATKENGEIFFEVPEDTYHIAILAAPDGYSYEADFEMYTKDHYGEPIDITIKKN